MKKVSQGSGYSHVELGRLLSLRDIRFIHPSFPMGVPGKVFLRDMLGLSGAEISVNCQAAGEQMPFLHSHGRNEEIYLFLGGRGEFQAGAEVFPVGEGSVVRLATWVPRSWRSMPDGPLLFIVIQVPENSYVGPGHVDDGIRLAEPPAWAVG